MKVLHFCMSKGWGGLEMASFQWARLFEEQGHESHSICYPGSPLAERLAKSSLRWSAMDFHHFSLFKSRQLRQYIVQNGIEAVYIQRLRDLWMVVPALWGTSCRLIGFAQMWLQGVNKKDPLHRLLYNRMDLMVTLTPRQGEQVLRCVPYPLEKTRVIPNSINTKKFSPDLRSSEIRTQFGAKDEDFLIGLVGRIDRQKGQKELVQAFALCKKARPSFPWKLVFVGEPTPGEGEAYKEEILDLIHKENLQSDIVLAGFREDVPAVMASLDVFILNSYQEAFGFVIVEAMASGTPVIATESGGVPDILQNGEYGLLVPPKDPQALSQALLRWANNANERRQQSEKSLAYARQEFDESRNFEKLYQYTLSISHKEKT